MLIVINYIGRLDCTAAGIQRTCRKALCQWPVWCITNAARIVPRRSPEAAAGGRFQPLRMRRTCARAARDRQGVRWKYFDILIWLPLVWLEGESTVRTLNPISAGSLRIPSSNIETENWRPLAALQDAAIVAKAFIRKIGGLFVEDIVECRNGRRVPSSPRIVFYRIANRHAFIVNQSSTGKSSASIVLLGTIARILKLVDVAAKYVEALTGPFSHVEPSLLRRHFGTSVDLQQFAKSSRLKSRDCHQPTIPGSIQGKVYSSVNSGNAAPDRPSLLLGSQAAAIGSVNFEYRNHRNLKSGMLVEKAKVPDPSEVRLIKVTIGIQNLHHG